MNGTLRHVRASLQLAITPRWLRETLFVVVWGLFAWMSFLLPAVAFTGLVVLYAQRGQWRLFGGFPWRAELPLPQLPISTKRRRFIDALVAAILPTLGFGLAAVFRRGWWQAASSGRWGVWLTEFFEDALPITPEAVPIFFLGWFASVWLGQVAFRRGPVGIGAVTMIACLGAGAFHLWGAVGGGVLYGLVASAAALGFERLPDRSLEVRRLWARLTPVAPSAPWRPSKPTRARLLHDVAAGIAPRHNPWALLAVGAGLVLIGVVFHIFAQTPLFDPVCFLAFWFVVVMTGNAFILVPRRLGLRDAPWARGAWNHLPVRRARVVRAHMLDVGLRTALMVGPLGVAAWLLSDASVATVDMSQVRRSRVRPDVALHETGLSRALMTTATMLVGIGLGAAVLACDALRARRSGVLPAFGGMSVMLLSMFSPALVPLLAIAVLAYVVPAMLDRPRVSPGSSSTSAA